MLTPPKESSESIRRPSKMVAVVVPASLRHELTPDEAVSLRHLLHFLEPYDKFLIAPKGSNVRLEGLETIETSKKYFGSVQGHGWLLYSADFYRRFQDYKYILLYHLDALVFRDELLGWCETDVDYLGAPWIPCADLPWVEKPAVGNGGFTLMKVETVLSVLRIRHESEPAKRWEDRLAPVCRVVQAVLRHPRRLAPTWLRRQVPPALRRQLDKIDGVEVNTREVDFFWSFDAVKYVPDFRIPDWRTALRFAFEGSPRLCYELNGRQLPFGCHAWGRYDRGFWEPWLLR